MKDRITINNIAGQARVSQTTVSFDLNSHFYMESEQKRGRFPVSFSLMRWKVKMRKTGAFSSNSESTRRHPPGNGK